MNTRAWSNTSGMVLLDIIMGATVLGVAVLGALSAIPATAQMEHGHREREEARLVMQRLAEEVFRSTPAEAFAEYNMTDVDDLDGPGTGHGPDFDLSGLMPTCGGAAVARIVLPTYTVGTG